MCRLADFLGGEPGWLRPGQEKTNCDNHSILTLPTIGGTHSFLVFNKFSSGTPSILTPSSNCLVTASSNTCLTGHHDIPLHACIGHCVHLSCWCSSNALWSGLSGSWPSHLHTSCPDPSAGRWHRSQHTQRCWSCSYFSNNLSVLLQSPYRHHNSLDHCSQVICRDQISGGSFWGRLPPSQQS